MDRCVLSKLLLVAFSISQSLSPVFCIDRMLIAEASEAVILMAEAKDYSFVDVNFTTIPLKGLVLPVGVEFDPRSEMVYWTDAVLHTVNRASINGSSQDVIARLQNTTGDRHYPYGIALNLDDDKVYWTDQYRGIIEVSNLDGTDRDNLLFVGFNSYPNGIVYSPIRRKIFWTDRGQHPRIETANPDGSNRVALLDGDVSPDISDPTGICLDSIERGLYWTDPQENTLEYINLDSMVRLPRSLRNSSHDIRLDIHPFSIAKYFEDIYFSDILLDRVFAIDFPVGSIAFVHMQVNTSTEIHIHADTSCPSVNLCASTGTCVVFERQPVLTFLCICDEGYHGAHCESNIDDCTVNPCSNGGSCTDGVNSFTCDCAPGYSGVNCTTDINDCDPNPCINGGTCSDEINSYTCECAVGYTDINCFTDINDCDPNPCMNGGTCNDGINSFTCYCALGYTDINCSTDINDCDPNPCKNGGACNDGINSYTCECALGYTDVNCSTAIDPCFYQTPCGVNEECTNTDLVEIGYFCNCSEGFVKRKDVCMASSSVGGSLRFDRVNGLHVLFTDSLGNPQSENYRNLEQICYKILRDILMGNPNLQNSDWDVAVTGFSPGSVVAEFMVMVFDPDTNTLKDQSSAVEAFLGHQDPGVWQAQDGSDNLNVLTITAFGEICLTSPCLNGMCLTTPGDIDYTCRCDYGFTGQHCETEVTCSLPFHPFSHVVRPKGVYRGDDFITIQCDEGEESVVWQCNGTTGTWKQLADLDCEPDDNSEGGISTGVIVGIVAGVVVVIIGMILFFLYKMAHRKRPTTTDGMILREQPTGQSQGQGLHGNVNQGARFGQSELTGAGALIRDRTGTLPAAPFGNFGQFENKDAGDYEDLPPAYNSNPNHGYVGGAEGEYAEVIFKQDGKPEDNSNCPSNMPLSRQNVYIEAITDNDVTA